ncbi:MAG: hypothetical protein ACKOHM_02015, partial [Spartobacteria bacterium]
MVRRVGGVFSSLQSGSDYKKKQPPSEARRLFLNGCDGSADAAELRVGAVTDGILADPAFIDGLVG